MRLFGTYLPSHGSSLGTYFRLLRPRGVPLDFREIVKRVNTPFMFCLKAPGSASLAEVSDLINILIRNFHERILCLMSTKYNGSCKCSGQLKNSTYT
jgi:hypothetical protein